MKRFAVIAGLVALVGCSTRPVDTDQARPVASSRFQEASESTGMVIIKRDTGLFGSMCSAKIYVDGLAVADISTSEKVTLYLPAGEHILGAYPNGICGGGLSEIAASIKKSGTLVYCVSNGSAGDFKIQRTAM